ncbi:MAG: DUF2884 family protein [Rhodanobacter sp.]
MPAYWPVCRPVYRLFVVLSFPLACGVLHAQQLAAVCHASSSYDLTIQPSSLLFDRAAPAPQRVVLQDGSLSTDGQVVALNDEDQDRIALFGRDLRALVPRVKAVASHGVDIATQAMHDEALSLNLSADTRVELDRRLAVQADQLKQRIAASHSTHDWEGDMANQYANQVAADIVPLLAADLGQQALSAAMSGDLQAAADLKDRASTLATQLQPRLQHRMQALRPQIQALCPDIQRLAELQQGLRGSNGRPLNLLQVGQ